MVLSESGRPGSDNLAFVGLGPAENNNKKTLSVGSLNTSVGSSVISNQPEDGSIVLGEKPPRGNRYVTRFSVNRDLQKLQLSNVEVIRAACCPCSLSDKRTTCLRSLWQAIRAESFLITLHIGAIVLGAVKEALDFRDYAEDLELAHSLAEIFIVVLIIVIRTVSVWHNYRDIREIREKIEHIDESQGIYIHSPHLKHLCIGFTFVAILMIIWSLTTFICFYFLAHLGWTVLSNNFALVIVTVLNGLMGERMATEAGLIKEDQHKAVIYESILLLTELSMTSEGPRRQHVLDRVQQFCRALRDTTNFSQPNYIDVPQKYKPKWDALVTMETFSTV